MFLEMAEKRDIKPQIQSEPDAGARLTNCLPFTWHIVGVRLSAATDKSLFTLLNMV